ncbi:MAG TPA: hypothetical protein VFR11_15045 [Micromonosporaceae bacterium]|jgi:hypothetical protein|nr:hypothetical protein [Micromonosporaceae bacterium]
MSRRAIAIVGAALAVGSCIVGGALPAVLKPGPPWYDAVAQQAAWSRLEAWLFGVAAMFAVSGYVLLAIAFTGRRTRRPRATPTEPNP